MDKTDGSICRMLCPRQYLSGMSCPFDDRIAVDGRCTVINRAVRKRHRQADDAEEWSEAYFPPSVVSPSERQQIMDLLPIWTNNLLVRLLRLSRLTESHRTSLCRILRNHYGHSSFIHPHLNPISPQRRDSHRSFASLHRAGSESQVTKMRCPL